MVIRIVGIKVSYTKGSDISVIVIIFRQNQALFQQERQKLRWVHAEDFFSEQRRRFCVTHGRRGGKNGNEQKSENEEKKLFYPAEHFKPPPA